MTFAFITPLTSFLWYRKIQIFQNALQGSWFRGLNLLAMNLSRTTEAIPCPFWHQISFLSPSWSQTMLVISRIPLHLIIRAAIEISLPSKFVKINFSTRIHFSWMNLHNSRSSFFSWGWEFNLSIQSTRT